MKKIYVSPFATTYYYYSTIEPEHFLLLFSIQLFVNVIWHIVIARVSEP
jgi:hypothetical protein